MIEETEAHNVRAFMDKMAEPLSTWDIEEYVSDIGTMVILTIHGVEYARGESEKSLELAYRALLHEIAPGLSRAVTIARLVGGEL